MDVEIRPIRSSDIAGFHRAVDHVAREGRYLFALEAPPFDSTARFVEGNIDGNGSQLVAVKGGEVVGWCDIIPRSDPVRQHVSVLGMGLLAPFRARGIGRRLLRKTLEHAQQHNFHRIELKVRATNARAMRLYASLGFVLEGTLKDDVFVGGQFDSTHCMALFPGTGA